MSRNLKVVVIGEDTYSYGSYNDKTLLLYSYLKGHSAVQTYCPTIFDQPEPVQIPGKSGKSWKLQLIDTAG